MTDHRVLHFLWDGTIGGAERALYQVVRRETALGEWDVGVAFGRAEGPYADAVRSLGCEVLDLRMRSAADFPKALREARRLRDYDIHHFHVMEPSQIAASVRCGGTTRVYTERGGLDAYVPRLKEARRAVGGMLLRRYFHGFAGNTQHAVNVAVKRYRLEGLPTHVTYNGIDFSLLVPGRDRLEVRRQLGIGSGDFVVGSSGTFKSWKRFDRVVGLLGEITGLHVVLIGDGDLRQELEQQARLLGAGERLHITGLVGGVADFVAAMDGFVLASTAAESFGNSVVESMALGVPSIVFSDSPGICEHIDNGVTGLIVDDQRGLAEAVQRLAEDPDLRSRLGEAGAAHVRSAYTLERMHDSYRGLYASALDYRAARTNGGK